MRLDLPAPLRAPDLPEDFRDEVEERFAAERDFVAPLFFAPVERFDPPAFEPRAEERELFEPELFVARFDDGLFEAPFDPPFVPPRADERELFAALLRDADFFALGGHSLLVTQVLRRTREALGLTAPVAALFQHPTIAGLAAVLVPAEDAIPRLEPARDEDALLASVDDLSADEVDSLLAALAAEG